MKSFAKAVYKPDSMSTDEYIIVIGDVSAAEKWKGGGDSIPLVDVVDSFDVFHTGQGSQGLMQRASKQDLDTIFGTTNDNEIVEQILTKGQIKSSDAPHKWMTTNDQRSGNYQTSSGAAHGGR
ncbi:hypothetical protein BMF94_5007 [Rhodotorula taiwanensis]|uniref:Ribosome maturation protein SDO1/SBDS N-terminal domain-containing protein n=1 Tax=Rhodotorula taiwanensis TaxID=741276 RepID=A0A2S5B5E6_9BASI|nr:hypothetical protein BMF94_5007 [Rhodotorula taiwanensis]